MKKNYRFVSLAALAIMFCFRTAIAQEVTSQYPKTNVISPTASALGMYVDFPVNLHTGVPEISLPIYTVQEGPLQLPITLSYHASGMRVQEVASWTGIGWSVNAGGVVSRTLNGLPDEKNSIASKSFFKDKGYSNYYLSPTGEVPYSTADYQAFITGTKDGEPDLFIFNFGSYSGKFYFREDQTAILFPETDLKIEPVLNQSSSVDYFQGFKITDPKGVKYYFGVTSVTGDDDPIEKSKLVTAGNLPFPESISSWYLYKIESSDGKFAINISYRREKFAYTTISAGPYLPPYSNHILPAKVLIDGVTPKEISFTNGKVEFVANTLRQDVGGYDGANTLDVPNTEAKRLEEIRIVSNPSAPTTSRSFRFTYGYFDDQTTQLTSQLFIDWPGTRTADRKRLKLLSVQETSTDNALSNPPYSFHYYDEQAVPRRLSFSQDHWGFNNGIQTNTTYGPEVSYDNGVTYYPGDDKDSRWPAMRAGALRMIQYPTGGGTEYIYEPNKVMTTSNCSFTQTGGQLFTVTAGMGTTAAQAGAPHILTVTTPTVYYYSVNANGSGSGKLLIDDNDVAYVGSTTPSASNFIFLGPGSHSVRTYANSDNTSGSGVLASFYGSTSSCDSPRERIVGGLRIQQINKFGMTDSPKPFMTYTYESANLYSIPVYVFKLKHDLFKTGFFSGPTDNGCKETTPGSNAMHVYSSPVSVHPMHTIQGYHIGYGKVKERMADGGYTISEFAGASGLPSNWFALDDVSVRRVNSSICSISDPTYPAVPLRYDFNRGSLKSKQVFDQNGTKLKETLYTTTYSTNLVGVFGVVNAPNPITGSTPLPAHYEITSAKLEATKQIEKTFNEGGSSIDIETITNFNSPYHSMPSAITQTSQNGVAEIKNLNVLDLTQCKYRCTTCYTDYVAEVGKLKQVFLIKDQNCQIGVCNGTTGFGSQYDNFLGWQDGSPCSGTINCRAAAWHDYQFRLNTARVEYTTALNSNTTANTTCNTNGVNNSTDAAIKALFLMEQRNQLNVAESSTWRDAVFQSSTFLEFEPQGTAMDVYLKRSFSTEVTDPSSFFTQANAASATIQKDPKYGAADLVFLYSEGRPVEVREKSGITTSYIWGLNNTVPIVKAVGVDYSVLQPAYTAAPTNLRAQPSLSQAQITTYTHEPAVGVTSITDANGKTLSYEYDKLGRLVRIKDHQGKIIEQFEYNYRVD